MLRLLVWMLHIESRASTLPFSFFFERFRLPGSGDFRHPNGADSPPATRTCSNRSSQRRRHPEMPGAASPSFRATVFTRTVVARLRPRAGHADAIGRGRRRQDHHCWRAGNSNRERARPLEGILQKIWRVGPTSAALSLLVLKRPLPFNSALDLCSGDAAAPIA